MVTERERISAILMGPETLHQALLWVCIYQEDFRRTLVREINKSLSAVRRNENNAKERRKTI